MAALYMFLHIYILKYLLYPGTYLWGPNLRSGGIPNKAMCDVTTGRLLGITCLYKHPPILFSLNKNNFEPEFRVFS